MFSKGQQCETAIREMKLRVTFAALTEIKKNAIKELALQSESRGEKENK